ncbi:ImcF-related family protein [Paraburkholderia humisilvae]|uniref:Type VI secretion protein VasK n=1 Tax=Paraburkholderia humisilvae TaxID=627669 RepID=A0A6J5EBX9_9BURK|nr:ImcF-related family protein [Paraburkholderia humisilvae]CAB3762702.1 hypothetical protein LMG29542_04431 [Paraburkholderia humisilvae]
MTSPTSNTPALRPASPTTLRQRLITLWGFPFAALGLALLAAALIWSKGELLDLTSKEVRISALLWTGFALAIVVIIHFLALSFGAYSAAARFIYRETGERPRAIRTLQRDPRLQTLCDELRHSHGRRWRYRLPWLMLTGSDNRIDEVAPGLKQAGAMLVAGTVLVHAAPDGIDPAPWRRQLKQLRRRRPIDSVVQVARVSEDEHRNADQARILAMIAADLGWAAPLTFLHAVKASGGQPERFRSVGVFTAGRTRRAMLSAADLLDDELAQLEAHTAYTGVMLRDTSGWVKYLAEVSAYIGKQRERIVDDWRSFVSSGWSRAPLGGVMFAPVFEGVRTAPVPVAADGTLAVSRQSLAEQHGANSASAMLMSSTQPLALVPVWQEIGRRLRHRNGRRVGFHLPQALAASVMLASVASCVAMAVSFIGNRQLIRDAHTTAETALAAVPGTPAALRAQRALQRRIDTLEYRRQHGVPWYLGAGLSRNNALLEALWQPYATVAARNLQRPVVGSLEARLNEMNSTRADALQTERTRQDGYDALKTYLMLADPQRTDAAFLDKMLVSFWALPPGMSAGERDDLAQHLAAFYATHLQTHPDWRIPISDALVTASRSTLINQIGLANGDDIVYRSILDDVKGKFADASLAMLLDGTDARGLFSTTQRVPGIYTRAAWDGMIADAIDKAASERRTRADWVLSGNEPARPSNAVAVRGAETITKTTSTDNEGARDALKQRLTARYFAEYTAAWQRMLNSVQWQPAANLNEAIDQLNRLADAQTSPLIALMKSVQYQAQAGRPSQALADTLVRKAQSLIGDGASTRAPDVSPLDKPFGPLLALMGDTGSSASANNDGHVAHESMTLNGISLAHYLTLTTTMRLKLQQIAVSPDAQAMARSLAQAVFQGRLSELAQARNDAALTAASLGALWSGFGDALFVQPLDTAWQTILQPAAASLNEAWRASIAIPFKTSFDGRYPFFETNADASFAELGRYVRPDTGLIARFLATELAGVLKRQGDQWVPDELAPQALRFDPAFLAAIRQLSNVGARAYAQGDAGYHFEIMALPSPNVTRTELSIDGKPIVYFNQKESWTALTWPGDGLNGRAGLMWQMVNAGLRQAFDATGDWAFLRLLAQAHIKPLDSTRYELTWDQPDAAPLCYVLRTQLGEGPLELLKLRGFRMPERIFMVGKAGNALAATMLPPLPPMEASFQ